MSNMIIVSTWNVEGKGSAEEIDEILFNTFKTKYKDNTTHVVCLQQANLPISGEQLKHFRWVCSGSFGSAVLISKTNTLSVLTSEQVCEQICVAEVSISDSPMRIISCYIPPTTNYITKDLWLKLVEVLREIPLHTLYILGGDFNAEIGREIRPMCLMGGDKGLIGPKRYHQISNENGIQLRKIALDFHAAITNTFGVSPVGDHLCTYKDEEEKSQRSFIIAPTDQAPYPSKTLLQESELSWHQGYKSAVLSRVFKDPPLEDLSRPISSLAVSSWNVQGASPHSIDKALNELDLPMVCIQDVFLTSDDDVKTNNYTWFVSKKLWGKNVGILVKNCPDVSMDDFNMVSECLCTGNVTVKGCNIKVISCSLPPHTDSERFQEVSAKLIELVRDIPKETVFVVGGDFNTHVTYTILNGMLVFDKNDGNALLLQKLMKECHLELPYQSKSLVTHVSENARKNSSFVLMSQSCMWKFSHKQILRWVPFFENAVVTLCMSDTEADQSHLQTSKNSEPAKDWNIGKVETINGLTYVTIAYCKIKQNMSVGTTEHQVFCFIPPDVIAKDKALEKIDLPYEIVRKYRNTPPPVDELLRILGDHFTLYFGFLQESSAPHGWVDVLSSAFRGLQRGPLLMECIDVLEEKTEELVKRIVRFRWNGIVVFEQEGGKLISFKRIINKGQYNFISILGQHCFTVRAKLSFYNKSLPQECDLNELDKVIRVIKRTDFPPSATIEEMRTFLKNYYARKPKYEMAFGEDFAQCKWLESIKKYVIHRNEGLRIFKSRPDIDRYDCISVYVKQSPHDIRRQLMRTPGHEDLKFQLIPPCGTDKDYFEWLDQWENKAIPDEYFTIYEKNKVEDKSAKPVQVEEPVKSTLDANKPTKAEDPEPMVVDGGEEVKRERRKIGFVEHKIRDFGNQTQWKLQKCVSLTSGNSFVTMKLPTKKEDWATIAREESDLPQSLVDKYCEDPPQIDELRRILGDDFILYYGFRRDSNLVSEPHAVLTNSFEALDRGGLMQEYIEVLKNEQPISRIVKLKWNGICINQEKGTVTETYRNIGLRGQKNLVDNLGQHFYAVKAKMCYFYNGTLPPRQDTINPSSQPHLVNEMLRIVDKSELAESGQGDTLEAAKNFINEFFREDTEVELVFGEKFSCQEILEPLEKFIWEQNTKLGYRWIKSKENLQQNYDGLGFFIKRTPLEIRDKLMKIPGHQDLRFFLVPPCEFFKKSHYEWIKTWAAENSYDEFKLLSEREELKSREKKPASRAGRRKAKPPGERKVTPKRNQNNRAPQNQNKRIQQNHSNREAQYRSPGIAVWERHQEPLSVAYPIKDRWSQLLNLGQDYERRREDHGLYHRRDSIPQLSRADNYTSDRSRGDRYDEPRDSYISDRSRSDRHEELRGRKRDREHDDFYEDNFISESSRSDNRLGNRTETPGHSHLQERYVPESKRARQGPATVSKPRWDDVAPLVMVWPVNVRSEQDRDAKRVLEANFPTEIVRDSNDRVAVYVTLPLRRGRNQHKKYCLCVGEGVRSVTRTALEMLAKRSSIIKYTESFLPPDGLIPNFIRYNIPCQTVPRTYIILSWSDTGPLTQEKVNELLENFKMSLNEDLFFDKNYYTHDMKQLLLDLASQHGLKARHFGTEHALRDRYVCVYKTKPKEEVLEEVLKMRDLHPKYKLTSNKLPPRLGLNIF